MVASCAPQDTSPQAGAGEQSERHLQVSQRPGIETLQLPRQLLILSFQLLALGNVNECTNTAADLTLLVHQAGSR